MTEHVDMSAFIAAKSDQLNADDLMDAPRTITITKVTAAPDAAEQPVSIHYEGGEGRPWKPCKTARRILVGVWGKDASKYVGRSLTLYRDPNVQFGGLQVGGIRVSHMSHISEPKTVALLVTRRRKAPFKIEPLRDVPQSNGGSDYSAELANLKAIATPGNMDALGAKWQEIGPEARKALASELPALKAACEKPADDVPFRQPEPASATTPADQLGLDDPHPAQAKAEEIIAEIEGCISTLDVTSVVARNQSHIDSFPDELGVKIEVAADKRRREIEAAREGVGAK